MLLGMPGPGSPEALSRLFPAGGPVAPEFVVGRVDDVDALVGLLREGIHAIVIGPRRTGKTTVCGKVCSDIASTHAVIRVEVPERPNAAEFLRQLVVRSEALSVTDEMRTGLRAARPFIQSLLKSHGLDLDLAGLGADAERSVREVLEFPIAVAREIGRPVVLFLDEVQRIVDYDGGTQLLVDLVDIYSGRQDVVILADGSDERAIEQMLGPPVAFGKLCRRRDLAPTIPRSVWRDALTQRFKDAGLSIDADALERILEFGKDRPYPTMTAAQDCAIVGKQRSNGEVAAFEVRIGIEEAQKRLRDDPV